MFWSFVGVIEILFFMIFWLFIIGLCYLLLTLLLLLANILCFLVILLLLCWSIDIEVFCLNNLTLSVFLSKLILFNGIFYALFFIFKCIFVWSPYMKLLACIWGFSWVIVIIFLLFFYFYFNFPYKWYIQSTYYFYFF